MFGWLKNLFKKEKTTTKKIKIISGIVSFGYIFGLGYLGSSDPGEWYRALIKPELTPPSYVFPIVWAILFFLIGLAGYYVWNFYESDFKRKLFGTLYLVNGIFVYLWSYFFFGIHDMNSALYTIIGIIIVAELMILSAFGTNKKSAYMLIPYLLWVLFATYLNVAIIALNS